MASVRITRLHTLVEKQRQKCALCDRAFMPEDPATIDHIVPKARGGSDAITNLQAAHWSCNHLKGDMLMETWRALYKHAPKFYALRSECEPIEVPKNAEAAMRAMAARIEVLERANARLHADWTAMREQIETIRKIVGRAGERGGIVEALRKKMAKENEREN